MKNTQFAMLIAIVGFFGVFASASAQLLPASEYFASKGELAQLLVVADTNNTNTGLNNPAITGTLTQISPAMIDPSLITVANSNTVVANHEFTTSVVYANPNKINTNGITIAQQPIIPAEPVVTVTPTPVSTPVVTSNGGIGVVSVGQHTGGGMYGAQVQPITTDQSVTPVATTPTQPAPRVIYKTVYKDAPVKEQIPLLDETTASVNKDRVSRSNTAASVAGLGSISLMGILGVIAVILMIMVVVQEYAVRKRYEQAARMHAHA